MIQHALSIGRFREMTRFCLLNRLSYPIAAVGDISHIAVNGLHKLAAQYRFIKDVKISDPTVFCVARPR